MSCGRSAARSPSPPSTPRSSAVESTSSASPRCRFVLDQFTWTALVLRLRRRDERRHFVLRTDLPGRRRLDRCPRRSDRRDRRPRRLTALCAGFGLGSIVPPLDQRAANYAVEWHAIVYPLAVNVLGIVVVALLSGYLAERLRRTGGELVVATERAQSAERLAILGRIAAGLATKFEIRSARSRDRSSSFARRPVSTTRIAGCARSSSARPGG